jgi:L-ribulose-5-phosphate 3-epimerase
MQNHSILSRLGVCSWSLQPDDPAQLIAGMRQIGLTQIQCALDPIRETPKVWGHFAEACQEAGLELVSGMFRTVGEDYSTLESIRRTGGVVPDAHWEENWRNIKANATLAKNLKLKVVAFHAGFLPHEPSDPDFGKLLKRIRQIGELYANLGIDLALETGQETAPTLKAFLEQLNCPGVGVNFDPANMILYDKGNPIEALAVLAPWLKGCHIKDAKRTRTPGTWGDEVVVGTGEVDWHAFLRSLTKLNFNGYSCLEREAGNQRALDLRAGRDAITRFAKEL